jgi:hypothetical protein
MFAKTGNQETTNGKQQKPGLLLLLEVVRHADDYDPFFEEKCAFEH